nr:hypothetical protein [Tanacetum cinerariifolium]
MESIVNNAFVSLVGKENVIISVQTFLRKFNRYSFFETPKVLLLAWDRVFEINDALGTKQYKPKDIQELFRQLLNDVQSIHEELAEYINTPGWNRPAFYDDDDDDDVDYTIAITPVLSTEKPVNSLSMGDKHLDTIPKTESDEVIKSSVEDLISTPSESKGIPKHKCDVPFHDNSLPLDVSKDQIEDFSKSNNEVSSIDDDSFSIDNIDFVEASPPDSELASSEVMEIVIPECPPSDRSDFTHEEFADDLAHIISPPDYDCFYFRDMPDPGITINYVYSFKLGLSHRCRAFKKFNTHRSHLNEWPMIINGKNTPILDVLLFHSIPLDQLNIPRNLKTLAKGFYPPSLNFLSFKWESCIQILSTNVLSFGIPNKRP